MAYKNTTTVLEDENNADPLQYGHSAAKSAKDEDDKTSFAGESSYTVVNTANTGTTTYITKSYITKDEGKEDKQTKTTDTNGNTTVTKIKYYKTEDEYDKAAEAEIEEAKKNQSNDPANIRASYLGQAYESADSIGSYLLDTEAIEASSGSQLLNNDLTGIFGMPYQFMDTVDKRIDGTKIGAKYSEKIVARMPLLFLTPCKQVFMPGYDDSSKTKLLSVLTEGADSGLMDSINGKGKYYTTVFAYKEYYEYVDVMCTILAYFMGIQDEVVAISGRSTTIGNIQWEYVHNSAFKSYFNAHSAVVFYADGLNAMSDSFSNNTGESSLASSINGYSDTVNELKFLLGDSIAGKLANNAGDAVSSITSGIAGLFGDSAGVLAPFAANGVKSILTGGKIIFPKIWQDSGYSRSYSFNVKLRSPNHDSLSIFFNILVPFIHLLAFVLPVGVDDDPNAYTSPFLLKAYSKGMFNIDMGLITDLSVDRGGEGNWNDNGLPTQMDISFSVEDLYSSLFMSKIDIKNDLIGGIIKNTGMLDYLCNMAGLNLADPEILRRVKMASYLSMSSFKNIPSKLWQKFDENVQNFLLSTFNKLHLI